MKNDILNTMHQLEKKKKKKPERICQPGRFIERVLQSQGRPCTLRGLPLELCWATRREATREETEVRTQDTPQGIHSPAGSEATQTLRIAAEK